MPKLVPIVALLLMSSMGVGNCASVQASPPEDEPINLRTYVAKVLRWHPAASGTLVGIDLDKTYPDDGAAKNLSAYERKIVKLGNLSVLVPDRMVVFDDEDLPSPYDLLSDDEKIDFLLATLGPAELRKLNGDGLRADDLRDEQHAAFLSMLPKPFKYQEGTVSGIQGTETGEDIRLPDDKLGQIRLQLHRGVLVSFGMKLEQNNGRSSQLISSLQYRGHDGDQIAILAGESGIESSALPGRIVKSVERKSEIDWTQHALAAEFQLRPKTTVGETVAAIRTRTGLEIYADRRIRSFELDAIGTRCRVGDLLRGMTLAVGGAIRKVGPVYVLTPQLEGQKAKETRLATRKYLENRQIHGRVSAWQAEVERRGLLKQLAFGPVDSFDGPSIPKNLYAESENPEPEHWVALTQLPGAIASAIKDSEAEPQPPTPGVLDPAMKGKVSVTFCAGFRFVLPDGRPLGYKLINQEPHTVEAKPDPAVDDSAKDFRQLKFSSVVAFRSDDPATVQQLCESAKKFHIPEIWLDSRSQEAVATAVRSGLTVDLVIRPWRVLPGESCADPDRTVMGSVGSKLNEVPETRIQPLNFRTVTYFDSFSPEDAGLSAH